MTPNNDQNRIKIPGFNNGFRSFTLTTLYWSAAVVVLIASIFFVIRVTSPLSLAVPTPDFTATLRQTVLEALGPPTGTPTPPSTPTQTLTPTPTQTPIASLTPTISPTSTPTPTSSNTPLAPSLTPDLPYNENEAFQIVPLSPAGYDYAIHLMEGFPEILPNGSLNEDYYQAFYHAVVMQYEALLRYPKDVKAPEWRWALAYNLARTGDPRSSILYATLLSQGITSNQLSLGLLPDWVQAQDPRLVLSIKIVDPLPDNKTNHLLELSTSGGGIYLWFVDTEEKSTIYALSDETDFSNPNQTQISWNDLNGDNIDDLVLYTPGPETRNLVFPRVFDLTQIPPREMAFKPGQDFEIGFENEYSWSYTRNNQDFFDLQFKSTGYPPCPVTITHTYHWTGRWLEKGTEDYKVQPVSSLLGYCELLVDQANSVWGLGAAIQIMEQLLPDWPPQSSAEKNYPADDYDKWRFKLGVYHALLGEFDLSANYFNGIQQSPVLPGSRWVTPAREFLEASQTPGDLYKACLDLDFCQPRIALQNLISSFSPEEFKNSLYTLARNGISVRFTDQFDFEGDGIPERWLTLRHQSTGRLEFWILSETDGRPQGLFVTSIEKNKPTLTRYTNLAGITYVWIGSQQSFRIVRYPNEPDALIELLPASYFYTDLTNHIAKNSLNALLAGLSAGSIRETLLTHHESDRFVCLTKEDCARFYYAMGLAAEFSGDEELAVDSYLKIWWDSFESPFSTIVRLKLAYKPGYGPIPTLTHTATTTYTPTATRTATATPTVTHTEDPNRTYTPSPTPSITPTPTNTTNPYP